jgi:hypothetical protein
MSKDNPVRCLRQRSGSRGLDNGSKPKAASVHVLARGQFIAHVNGQITGHHDELGAYDRKEITSAEAMIVPTRLRIALYF